MHYRNTTVFFFFFEKLQCLFCCRQSSDGVSETIIVVTGEAIGWDTVCLDWLDLK